MKLALSSGQNLSVNKTQLNKYISVRKEQSQRFKAENNDGGADDDV